MTTKPKVSNQGKAVIELHGAEWLVMLPDGNIRIALSKKEAEKTVRTWFKFNADEKAFNVGLIEWRT